MANVLYTEMPVSSVEPDQQAKQESASNGVIAPTFTEEWELAPRTMTNYVESNIAEYWFLRGVRAGEAGAMVTMNQDLREIRRVAGERLTSAIREGR